MEDAGASLRRRSTVPPSSSSSSSSAAAAAAAAEENEEKKKSGSSSSSASSDGISWGMAFVILLFVRHMSAKSNIIHDCDEVFNYWEPLHYLLYKSGFQTWEYSSEFALRSYLYLQLHGLVAFPFTWWYGQGPGKVQVFYTVRLMLALFSAGSEAALVTAISRCYGKRLAAYTLMLLCFTTGCFNASTSFLPSTFSMYSLTLTVAAVICGKPLWAIAVAAAGVLIGGWPFSFLAVFPIVVYALIVSGFIRATLVGLVTSVCILVSSLLCDRFFYGRWTSSVINLVLYNVFGGGNSKLYGVEPPTFYLRNGFNNFNFALILALILPTVVLIARKRAYYSLLVLVSPIFIWLGFMSLQAHKEERFLYPVYTLICLAAAAAVECFPEVLPEKYQEADDSILFMMAKFLRPIVLGAILVLSYSRTTSLLNGYSAPLQVLRHLPSAPHDSFRENDVILCIGSEWHRYPSSFFLPSPDYQVKWLDDGFKGLLPFPFNSSAGGTAAAPPYFNNLNQASPEQYISDEGACSFLVELDLQRNDSNLRGDNRTIWEVVVELPFLDKERSPTLHRAFFIPWVWQHSNFFGSYRLLRKRLSPETRE